MSFQHLFSIMVIFPCVLDVVPGVSLSRSSHSEVNDQQRRFCDKGQYAEIADNGTVSCYVCPVEHFMDEDNHNHTECNRCKEKDEHITAEIVIKDCTPESDRVIDCIDGYFFDWNRECKLCARCERLKDKRYLGEPCSRDRNTICCPSPNMKVEWNNGSHSFDCVPGTSVTGQPTPTSQNCEGSVVRRTSCLKGEYVLRQCQTGDWVTCKPCPKHTFMNLSMHNETSCFPCSLRSESDLFIAVHCTLTHDNVYEKEASITTDMIIVVTVAAVLVLVVCVICVYFCCCKSSNSRAVTAKYKQLFAIFKRKAESDTDTDNENL